MIWEVDGRMRSLIFEFARLTLWLTLMQVEVSIVGEVDLFPPLVSQSREKCAYMEFLLKVLHKNFNLIYSRQRHYQR